MFIRLHQVVDNLLFHFFPTNVFSDIKCFNSWPFPTGTAVLCTCFLQILALRMNKMLSNDCLGTQEPHTFCKTTETLEHSHLQEITLDKTAAGSTLISHQNGRVCIVSSVIYLARFILIFPTVNELCISCLEIIYGQSSSTKDNLYSMLQDAPPWFVTWSKYTT